MLLRVISGQNIRYRFSVSKAVWRLECVVFNLTQKLNSNVGYVYDTIYTIRMQIYFLGRTQNHRITHPSTP